MLTNELERAGIPAVLITNLVLVAESMNVNRYIQGVALENVVGHPALPAAEDRRLRRQIVERALETLRSAAPVPRR